MLLKLIISHRFDKKNIIRIYETRKKFKIQCTEKYKNTKIEINF